MGLTPKGYYSIYMCDDYNTENCLQNSQQTCLSARYYREYPPGLEAPCFTAYCGATLSSISFFAYQYALDNALFGKNSVKRYTEYTFEELVKMNVKP